MGACFPDQAEPYGFQLALNLGLAAPTKRHLSTTALVDYTAIVAALLSDAEILATRFDTVTAGRLGTAPAATPLTEAMWAGDERYQAWAQGERERARQLPSSSPPTRRRWRPRCVIGSPRGL